VCFRIYSRNAKSCWSLTSRTGGLPVCSHSLTCRLKRFDYMQAGFSISLSEHASLGKIGCCLLCYAAASKFDCLIFKLWIGIFVSEHSILFFSAYLLGIMVSQNKGVSHADKDITVLNPAPQSAHFMG
jgi:hypothetical protein